MESSRLRIAYLLLLPALILAAGVLGYYTLSTARTFERLGAESIAESSLLLLEDQVERIERQIIAADNAAFGAIDLDDERSVQRWKDRAEEISPSVRALIVLDEQFRILGYAARASASDQRAFRRLFASRLLPDLSLGGLQPERLMHLHRTYESISYLISYRAVEHDGLRRYLVAHHDTGYIVRTWLSEMLRGGTGLPSQNVLDQDNRRIYGPRLSESSDYVFARRFPTTLYMWRIQNSPTSAPLLEQQASISRANQVALVSLALVVMVIAVGFILWAAVAERKLASLKSDFIANVSHELKTPLSVIKMFGEMLLTKRVGDEQKREEYLEIICSETERLTSLLENVLDFAAIERGKRRFTLKKSDLVALSQRAIDTLHYRFEREGVEVRLAHNGEAANCLVDEQGILLVLINLLDNAVKYGGGTPIDVVVNTLPDAIEVSVRDRGPGIARADRKRVFERFYRTGQHAHVRGSGIGLAIVKRIAEEHHGRVWAAERDGGGAVVGFTIPRRDPTLIEAPSDRMSHPDAIDSGSAVDIVARDG